MTRIPLTLLAAAVAAGAAATPLAGQGAAPQPPQTLAARIAHTDPARFRPSRAVHDGAGELDFTAVLTAANQDTNFYFLHRGVIQPKSGIGQHFHNQCEEMFVILDGEAQFTIDGRTSVLKGPAGAPAVMGHSHAIYNATDKPVQWMNLNVTAIKGVYDAFNLGDTREGAPVDPVPQFMTMRLDRTQMTPANALRGGTGPVQYRRALGPSVFSTTWAYVDHVVVPPGSSLGAETLRDVGEIYYAMSGEGVVKIGTESAPFATGDALSVRMNEAKTFEATGAAPLELLVVGVAKDMTRKTELVASPRLGGPAFTPPGGGGRGRGAQR
jgi:mannose-6-phosphate isomerase-like protein (cupin superfamily)